MAIDLPTRLALNNLDTPPHGIVYMPRFESEAGAIEPNVRLFDLYIAGVEWAIARNPERYNRIAPNHPLRIAPVGYGDIRLMIYYTIEANGTCHFHSVREPPAAIDDIPF